MFFEHWKQWMWCLFNDIYHSLTNASVFFSFFPIILLLYIFLLLLFLCLLLNFFLLFLLFFLILLLLDDFSVIRRFFWGFLNNFSLATPWFLCLLDLVLRYKLIGMFSFSWIQILWFSHILLKSLLGNFRFTLFASGSVRLLFWCLFTRWGRLISFIIFGFYRYLFLFLFLNITLFNGL